MSWRRRGFRSASSPPHWWPHNEPWPPRGRGFQSDERRSQFLRRVWRTWWIVGVSLWIFGGPARRLLRGAFDGAAVPTPLLIMLAVFVGGVLLLITRRVAYPISDLIAAADRVSQHDYHTRVPERGPRPVREVARAFNAMAIQLDAHDTVRRNLMADIAHELRTPVSVIQGRLEGLLDGVYTRDDAQLSGILDDTRVLARLIEDLRTVAEAESGALVLHKEPIELDALLEDARGACAPQADARGVLIDVDVEASLPSLVADPVRLREVLTNLITNAVRHTPAGGRVTLRAVRDSTRIALSVRDTGEGIPPETLPHVFDRFVKGRDSGGSGLGLAIARNLVEAHGGTLRAESRVGAGTTMTFTLPLGAPDA